MHISIIAAQTKSGIIGVNGSLPWAARTAPWDISSFTKLTTGHPVIMGRKCFYSIPENYRPLKGRTNIIVSRTLQHEDGCCVAKSLDEALEIAEHSPGSEEVFVAGGGEIYSLILQGRRASRFYLSTVDMEPKQEQGNTAIHLSGFNPDDWRLISLTSHASPGPNKYGGIIEVFERKTF